MIRRVRVSFIGLLVVLANIAASEESGCSVKSGATQEGICISRNKLEETKSNLDHSYQQLITVIVSGASSPNSPWPADEGNVKPYVEELKKTWELYNSAACTYELLLDQTAVGFSGEQYACQAEKNRKQIEYIDNEIKGWRSFFVDPKGENVNISENHASDNGAVPSFDCNKATSKQELLICSDDRLKAADKYLEILYRSEKKLAKNESELKRMQLDWMKNERGKCFDVMCLIRSYNKRAAELSQ